MATVTQGGTVGPSRGQLDQQKMAEFAKSMQSMGQSMRAYGQLREEKRQFDVGQQFDFLKMQAEKAQFGPVQFAVENPDLYKGVLQNMFGRSKSRDKLVGEIYKGLSTGMIAFEDVLAASESMAAQGKARAEEMVMNILGEGDSKTDPKPSSSGTSQTLDKGLDPKPPSGGVYPGQGGGTEQVVVKDIGIEMGKDTGAGTTVEGGPRPEDERRVLPLGNLYYPDKTTQGEPGTIVGQGEPYRKVFDLEGGAKAPGKDLQYGSFTPLGRGQEEYLRPDSPQFAASEENVLYQVMTDKFGMSGPDMYGPEGRKLANRVWSYMRAHNGDLADPKNMDKRGLAALRTEKPNPAVGNYIVPENMAALEAFESGGGGAEAEPGGVVDTAVAPFSKGGKEHEVTTKAFQNVVAGKGDNKDKAVVDRTTKKAVNWVLTDLATAKEKDSAIVQGAVNLLNLTQRTSKAKTGDDNPIILGMLAKINAQADAAAATGTQARAAMMNAETQAANQAFESQIWDAQFDPKHPLYAQAQKKLLLAEQELNVRLVESDNRIKEAVIKQVQNNAIIEAMQNPAAAGFTKDDIKFVETEQAFFNDTKKRFSAEGIRRRPTDAVKAGQYSAALWEAFIIGPEGPRYIALQGMLEKILSPGLGFAQQLPDVEGAGETSAAEAFIKANAGAETGFGTR